MNDSSKVPSLTGIRALLAWWVVWFHFGREVTPEGPLQRVAACGHLAVDVFFVLSGYILTVRYRAVDLSHYAKRRAFWSKRVVRVYPLYVLSLVLGYAASWPRSVTEFDTLLGIARLGAQLLLLNAWWHPAMFAINWAAWSLSVEVFFYILFPFALRRMMRWRSRHLMIAIFTFWCATFFAPGLYSLTDPDGLGSPLVVDDNALWCWYLKFFPAQRIFEFFAGIALALFVHRHRVEPNRNWHLATVLGGLSLVGAGTLSLVPFAYLHSGVMLPAVLAIILGLDRSPDSVFSHRIFVTLGRTSYATYILHVPVFFLVARLEPSAWQKPRSILIYCALLLAFSVAAYELIERPTRRWATRRPRDRS